MLHFEPGAALAQIEQERATWLYSVFPPIVMALIRHPDFSSRDLSSVRGLLNVAPPDTLRLIQDAFRPAVHVGGHFGMTECAGAITCNEWEASEEHQAETCGPALPGVEVRVVDPETRRAARSATDRRAPDPRLRAVRGLLPATRPDRGDVRPRGLAALRRPGTHG